MIRRVEVYETRGRQFPSLQSAVSYRENEVEAFLRTLPGFQSMPARERVEFVRNIIEQRQRLRDLLDFEATE